jgi:hypothetical protein
MNWIKFIMKIINLQMREKVASMDVERGQALATAWLMVQDEECL